MKLIKKGIERNDDLKARITCKLCCATLEITPEDCDKAEGDPNFWIKCPSCQQAVVYHIRDVGVEFWLKIDNWEYDIDKK